MSGNIDYSPLFHGLFFMTTILFISFSASLIFHISKLMKKNQKLREMISEKEKEITEIKTNTTFDIQALTSERTKSILISVNKDYKITYANEYALELFKFTKEELIGQNIFGSIYPQNEFQPDFKENIITRIFQNPNLYMEHESENIKKDGEKIWISWTNRVVYNENNEAQEIKSVGFDISKRKKLENDLYSVTFQDATTLALNRQTFMDLAVKELKRSNLYNRQLSILVLKLNCFENSNNLQNEDFTDTLLKDVINLSKKIVRECDIIGRISDVEFAILLPETSFEKAQFFAEQLKMKIEEKNLKDGLSFFVTANFGIASKETKNENIDTLLQKAINSLVLFEKNHAIQKQMTKKGAKK